MLLSLNPDATRDVPNDWSKFKNMRYGI
jgi:hypothetical protein